MATETEIKLRLAEGVAGARAKIEGLGYRVGTPRQLERDQLYDRANQELRQTDQILRLRTRGAPGEERCTLTYKGPAERAPYKSREELEVDVTDGATFERVLASLGYYPTFRYEKYRTTFVKHDEPGLITPGLITIDETPIGDFLELEGAGGWIDATALELGYSVTDYVTGSYASLYRKYCEANPAAVPSAMTF